MTEFYYELTAPKTIMGVETLYKIRNHKELEDYRKDIDFLQNEDKPYRRVLRINTEATSLPHIEKVIKEAGLEVRMADPDEYR